MRFDSLVRVEQTLGKKWVTYYLTLNGKYFKIATKTAMLFFHAFELHEGHPRKNQDGTITIFYYQK